MQTTGLLRRIAAMLYDTLLILALLFLATTPFIAVRGGEAVASDENFIYRVVVVLVIYIFFVGFWSYSGRTLGMQSWRLQLQDDNGQVPSVARASLRFVASLLSWLPLGLGFVWQLWDPQHLTWHDRISKTRLVYYPKKTE